MALNTTNFKCFRYTLIQSKNATIELQDLLHSIAKLGIKERNKDLRNGKEVRLENYKKLNNFHVFDFIQRKYKGLGRAKEDTPSVDIKLNSGELFTDSTTGIYCPKTKQLAIEYNHLGVRSGDIQDYLSQFVQPNQSYEFRPWLINEFERVLKHGAGFRKFEFSGHYDELKTIEDQDLTIANALKIAESSGARRVSVSLSVGNAKNDLHFASLKKLLKIFHSNNEVLSKLSVKGSFDDLGEFDLNLLDGVIDSRIFEDILLKSANIPVSKRYEMLEEAIKIWVI